MFDCSCQTLSTPSEDAASLDEEVVSAFLNVNATAATTALIMTRTRQKQHHHKQKQQQNQQHQHGHQKATMPSVAAGSTKATTTHTAKRAPQPTFTAEHVRPALVVPTPVVSTDRGLSFAANRRNWLFPHRGHLRKRNFQLKCTPKHAYAILIPGGPTIHPEQVGSLPEAIGSSLSA